MNNLKELKIAVRLAKEAYNEHHKTLQPYKNAYIKALAAYDKALDDALEDALDRREQWQATMDEARAALAATEDKP